MATPKTDRLHVEYFERSAVLTGIVRRANRLVIALEVESGLGGAAPLPTPVKAAYAELRRALLDLEAFDREHAEKPSQATKDG